jgi:16S rRNA (adenine1518-N6/adenine1519-N6)-dimethyltransferase
LINRPSPPQSNSTPSTLPTFELLMLKLRIKGFWQRRALGQHFLTDAALTERIADLAGCDRQTLAVEIGPGPGTLTAALAARAGRVLAIELDQRLRTLHEEVFGPGANVEFQYADALRQDLAALARDAMKRHGLKRAVLAGNLPFQITSPLLFGQSGPDAPWRRICVMVQQEVAQRLAAAPGGPNPKDYGVLTVKMACWWHLVERIEVGAEQFFPRPKVNATVVAFEALGAEQTPSPEEWASLSPFIDAAFAQRRKMIVNSLTGAWKACPDKPAVVETMERLGLPDRARAETLDPATLRKLHGELTPSNRL